MDNNELVNHSKVQFFEIHVSMSSFTGSLNLWDILHVELWDISYLSKDLKI